MWTAAYWKQVAERAIKAAAAAALSAYVVGDQITNAFNLDWKEAAGLAVGGAITSILLSIASAPLGPGGTPSVVPVPPPEQPVASR